jgi:hypothetical protein
MERSVGVAVMLVALAGAAAADPAGAGKDAKPAAGGEFTLGLVQRGLKQGLSQADVAERLGSPNIVTRAAAGREAWVYDRIATETEGSGRHVGIGGGGLASGASTLGLLGLGAGAHSERARSSQKTLTVVVRFAADGTVESFTFHHSRF